MRKAGNQKVSDSDNRNLVEFWQQIYDIDISPDEIPLLKDACCFWIDGKWEE
jgi:hypothetical protein